MAIFVSMEKSIIYIRTYKFQLILLLLSILWVGIVNYILNLNQQTYIFPDTISYIKAAEKFYYTGQSDATRPLLIAMINGFPLAFGCSKQLLFSWSLIINLISWFSTLILLFEILKNYLPVHYAFSFTLVYLFSITSTLLLFHLLTETIFILGLVFTLFCFQKYYLTKIYRYLAIGIGVLILCILIKPSTKILVLFISLFFLKTIINQIFNKWSIALFAPLFLLLFHVFQVNQQFGNYTITYTDSKTYYNYLGTRADCFRNEILFEEYKNPRASYFDRLPLTEQKKVAFMDVKEQIKNNKWNLFKAYCINVFGNATKGNPSLINYINRSSTSCFESFKLIFRVLSKLQNCIFSIIGIVLSIYVIIKRNRSKISWITSVFVLYFIAISGISSGQGDRFHLVIYPMVLIMISGLIYSKKAATKVLSE